MVLSRWLPLVALAGFLVPEAPAQDLHRYTFTETGPTSFALGYPVPQPVDSLTPVDGFRSYGSLRARHQALAMEFDFISGHRIGGTIKGRDIFAYIVSDPDGATVDGNAEPAFLVNGGIHAREWQSPEVVTGIIERFAERRGDRGLYDYLVDNTRLVAIPVLNVDGFLQTQRYPARVLVGGDPADPSWPRDGRMRRKNLRDADEDLLTFGDYLNGVDLNRNNPPFAPAFSSQASPNPISLEYHGGGARTEPETQALGEAIPLAGRDRLRMFTDFHSFSALFYEFFTSNSRRNQINASLVSRAIRTLRILGTSHTRRNSTPIGSTDELFASDIQVPAWTHELEPGFTRGGRQYGGFGVTHDGFILPDSEVARLRGEIADTYAMLFYAQAGPPAVSAVRVLDPSGNTVWGGEWRRDGPGAREFVTTATANLLAGGEYRLWIAFDKPMRHRDANGALANYPGMSVPLAPDIRLDGLEQEIAIATGEGRWLDEAESPGHPGFRRYRDDAFIAPFAVPGSIDPGANARLTLHVTAEDLAEQALDADPASAVDWSGGHWVEYETSDGTDADEGGTDATIRIPVSKEAPVAVKLGADRERALEGSRVELTLERDSTGGRITVALTAERVTGETDPVVESLFQTRVEFHPGGAGEEAVAFSMPDDVEPTGPGVDEVRVTATVESGNAVFDGPAALAIQVADNDTAGRRVISILERHPFTLPPDVSPLPPGLSEGARLADAIEQANAAGAPVTINLADGGLYSLNEPVEGGTTGFPPITGRVGIEGRHTTIARHDGDLPAQADFRLFHVMPGGDLDLEGVRLERGSASGAQAGGAVLNEGSLNSRRVVFRNNTANRAGAVANRGAAQFIRSAFLDNSSAAGGGAIHNDSELNLFGVTFSGNATDGRGGAVLNDGVLTLSESTLTGNQGSPGADLFNTGSARIFASIMASPGSCAFSGGSDVVSDGFNLDADASCGLDSATDLAPSDPLLGPLDDSALHQPGSGSPLIGAIPQPGPGCLTHDARGVPRPFASTMEVTFPPSIACEAGAAELGLSVHRGMWFNPDRSGHGIDLQQAGNQLIVTWFTYGPDGTPVWYQASGPFSGETWEADLLRYRFDHGDNEAEGEIVGTATLTFETGASATFAWDLAPIGQGAGSEPFEPLLFGEGGATFDTTGHWAAADGSSWGLSVDVQGGTVVATIYYYDADGDPRWVQGSGGAGIHSSMEVASFTGFCPGCDMQAFPFTMTPAGSIDLRFLTRRFGEITTNFMYAGAAGGEWQREVGLGALSDPVP